MPTKKYEVAMEIAGNTAIWTDPASGDVQNSYPAPTYSAVKALFESILWGPAVEIIPTKVEICAPIRYYSYCSNYGGPLRKSSAVAQGNNYQLRASVLIDVCYRLYADVTATRRKEKLTENAVRWDKNTTSPGHAYQAIFERRLKRGQSYANLFLGWNEFSVSYFGPFRSETKVCSDMPDILIPSMLREVFPDGYKSEYRAVYDNDLCIKNGVLRYPERR